METAFYNTYAIPTQSEAHLPEQVRSKTEACAVAERWGREDACAGRTSRAATYYTPDSPEWHAYELGYLQGSQRQATLLPSLWTLRGYEDACFQRPTAAGLPSQPAERCDYLRGYADGTAMQRQVLSAPPPSHSPGLWALRGYEDALFERPIRPGLPSQPTDHHDYLLGYAEGAATLQKILSAPPPTQDPSGNENDPEPLFYFQQETKQ